MRRPRAGTTPSSERVAPAVLPASIDLSTASPLQFGVAFEARNCRVLLVPVSMPGLHAPVAVLSFEDRPGLVAIDRYTQWQCRRGLFGPRRGFWSRGLPPGFRGALCSSPGVFPSPLPGLRNYSTPALDLAYRGWFAGV